MNPFVRLYIEANIQHYRDLLTRELDPDKRRIIAQLLGDEEFKLADLAGRERRLVTIEKRDDELC